MGQQVGPSIPHGIHILLQLFWMKDQSCLSELGCYIVYLQHQSCCFRLFICVSEIFTHPPACRHYSFGIMEFHGPTGENDSPPWAERGMAKLFWKHQCSRIICKIFSLNPDRCLWELCWTPVARKLLYVMVVPPSSSIYSCKLQRGKTESFTEQ